MPVSGAQRRASDKYNKQHTTTRGFRFGPADADVLAWMDAQPNKSGYIKSLIRTDMESRKAEAPWR